MLSDDLESRRSEVLLNIDQIEKSKSLRMGDMKLVSDEKGSTRHCAGWYPPNQLDLPVSSPCDYDFDIKVGPWVRKDEMIGVIDGSADQSVVEKSWLRFHPRNTESKDSVHEDFSDKHVRLEYINREDNELSNRENVEANHRNVGAAVGNYIASMVQRQELPDIQEVLRSIGRIPGRSAAGSPLVVSCELSAVAKAMSVQHHRRSV